jgi:hypothetical protein
MWDLRYSFRMDLDSPLSLTPGEQLRVDQAMERFWNLLNSERSRYETQARGLIESQTLVTETDDFVVKYKINGDRYISQGNPKAKGGQSFSIEFPIPTTDQEKIESLVELFAQSEAESSKRD